MKDLNGKGEKDKGAKDGADKDAKINEQQAGTGGADASVATTQANRTPPAAGGEEKAGDGSNKRREAEARLQAAIAKKRCEFCGVTGCWDIKGTKGKVRKLECRGCGRANKIAVE